MSLWHCPIRTAALWIALAVFTLLQFWNLYRAAVSGDPNYFPGL